MIRGYSGKQPGDPARAAGAELTAVRRDLNDWSAVSLAADFSPGQS
jgi:hypothetical protein